MIKRAIEFRAIEFDAKTQAAILAGLAVVPTELAAAAVPMGAGSPPMPGPVQGTGLGGGDYAAAGLVVAGESAIEPTNFIEQNNNLSAQSVSPGHGLTDREILKAAGIDYDAELKEMQGEDERLALEKLATPRKRKIRKPRP